MEAGGISLVFHAGADTFISMFKLFVVSCHGLDRLSRGVQGLDEVHSHR
jgi:hypothetical protein